MNRMNVPLQLDHPASSPACGSAYPPIHVTPRLRDVREEIEPETVGDWTVAHERIVAFGVERAARERDVCRWLLAAERLGIASRSGVASLGEYAERVLGLSPEQTEERLRMGRELLRLPVLDGALARGELCFTAARELTRVATPETEAAWCDFARDKRTREVTAAVAGRAKGSQPDERPDPELLRDHCQLAAIDAGGERHEVDDVTAERMECDAQHIGRIDRPLDGAAPTEAATGTARAARATQTIPPATRRQVMRRDRGRCVVAGCNNHRYLDVHHLVPRSEGGTHDVDNIAVLCGSCRVARSTNA